jgi:hypothetical protein
MVQSQRLQTPETKFCCACPPRFYIPLLPILLYCLLSPSSFRSLGGTTGRSALDRRLGIGFGQVLQLALLAVRPLRESQLLLAPALSQKSLIILQAAAHDARGDREVAVVGKASGFPRERHFGGLAGR